MKITPIEIRQKVFAEKMLRGYDKDEVSAFLQSLSQEWERVLEENREYRIKLEVTQKEVQKLREVETSLYRTLKTAEDTSSQLIEQANRSADLQMREARNQADTIMHEARNKAQQMIQNAENQSRAKLEETLTELKSRENDFRQLERLKESLIKEIQNIASDTLDRINRVAEKANKNVFEEKIREVREALEQKPKAEEIPEIFLRNTQEPPLAPTAQHNFKISGKAAPTAAKDQIAPVPQGSVIVKSPSIPSPDATEEPAPKGSSSFFDEI